MATMRDGYVSIIGGLGLSKDKAITTKGVGAELLLSVMPAEFTKTRTQAVMMNEGDVRNLVDDLNKWLACR